MQLIASVGREHGDTPGFGWIPGEVVRIVPADPALKIPHMGWNALDVRRPHPLLADIASGDHAYFVHSYHLVPERADELLATVDHGGPVTAVVGRDNLAGTHANWDHGRWAVAGARAAHAGRRRAPPPAAVRRPGRSCAASPSCARPGGPC